MQEYQTTAYFNLVNQEIRLSNPVLGKSWEGFVIENIHSILPGRAETYFYRANAGAEIDLVIKMPSSEIWAIELKYGVAPKLRKHFSKTCDDVGARYKYILYGGEDEFTVGDDINIIPLRGLMDRLCSATTKPRRRKPSRKEELSKSKFSARTSARP